MARKKYLDIFLPLIALVLLLWLAGARGDGRFIELFGSQQVNEFLLQESRNFRPVKRVVLAAASVDNAHRARVKDIYQQVHADYVVEGGFLHVFLLENDDPDRPDDATEYALRFRAVFLLGRKFDVPAWVELPEAIAQPPLIREAVMRLDGLLLDSIYKASHPSQRLMYARIAWKIFKQYASVSISRTPVYHPFYQGFYFEAGVVHNAGLTFSSMWVNAVEGNTNHHIRVESFSSREFATGAAASVTSVLHSLSPRFVLTRHVVHWLIHLNEIKQKIGVAVRLAEVSGDAARANANMVEASDVELTTVEELGALLQEKASSTGFSELARRRKRKAYKTAGVLHQHDLVTPRLTFSDGSEPALFTLESEEQFNNAFPMIATVDARNQDDVKNFLKVCSTDNFREHNPSPAAVDAQYYLYMTHKFYSEMVGVSLPELLFNMTGQPSPVYAAVNIGDEAGANLNARWIKAIRQVWFGAGNDDFNPYSTDPYIVAHEFTHGVLHGLDVLQSWDPITNAINEGLCDIMGWVVRNWIQSIEALSDGATMLSTGWCLGSDIIKKKDEKPESERCLRHFMEPVALSTSPSARHTDELLDSTDKRFKSVSFESTVSVIAHTNRQILTGWFALLVSGGSNELKDHSEPRLVVIPAQSLERVVIVTFVAFTSLNNLAHFCDVRSATVNIAGLLYPNDHALLDSIEAAWDEMGVTTDRSDKVKEPFCYASLSYQKWTGWLRRSGEQPAKPERQDRRAPAAGPPVGVVLDLPPLMRPSPSPEMSPRSDSSNSSPLSPELSFSYPSFPASAEPRGSSDPDSGNSTPSTPLVHIGQLVSGDELVKKQKRSRERLRRRPRATLLLADRNKDRGDQGGKGAGKDSSPPTGAGSASGAHAKSGAGAGAAGGDVSEKDSVTVSEL